MKLLARIALFSIVVFEHNPVAAGFLGPVEGQVGCFIDGVDVGSVILVAYGDSDRNRNHTRRVVFMLNVKGLDIRYNPDDQADSRLYISIFWAVYARVGLGVCFLCFGSAMIIPLLRRKKVT